MKNFLLERINRRHSSSWVLLHIAPSDPSQVEYLPFTEYVYWLEKVKGYAPNTIDQYTGHVARFLDFVCEASKLSAGDPEFTALLYSYQQFLLYGKQSEDPVACELALRLDKGKVTTLESVSSGIESSIRLFITFQLAKSENIDSMNLFSQYYLSKVRRLQRENAALRENSWLAGTIRNSLTRVLGNRGESIFPYARRRAARSSNHSSPLKTKPLPLEYAVKLLTQPQNIRAKAYDRETCIYALLAASGVRTSECLQLKISDIDIDTRTVRILSPFDRHNYGITEIEARMFSWKGRATDQTFLIEPFASIFWQKLRVYLERFYNTNVNHEFLFQKSDGRPMFTSDRSSRDATFKRYALNAGVNDLEGISLHSLRHMYGTYVLNYLPTDGGKKFGLPMAYVKILMGHQSVKSTEKYALQDTDLLDLYIELANNFVRDQNVNFRELKSLYFDRQFEKLQNLRAEHLDV